MKTIIIAAIALTIGIGGTLVFYKPKPKKIEPETVLSATFKAKEWNNFFAVFDKQFRAYEVAKDTTARKAAKDTLYAIFPTIFKNIDSSYNAK